MTDFVSNLRCLLEKARKDNSGNGCFYFDHAVRTGDFADYVSALLHDAPALLDEIDRLKKEQDNLLDALTRLSDVVHARLCWQIDYGRPPSDLKALKEARNTVAKLTNPH